MNRQIIRARLRELEKEYELQNCPNPSEHESHCLKMARWPGMEHAVKQIVARSHPFLELMDAPPFHTREIAQLLTGYLLFMIGKFDHFLREKEKRCGPKHVATRMQSFLKDHIAIVFDYLRYDLQHEVHIHSSRLEYVRMLIAELARRSDRKSIHRNPNPRTMKARLRQAERVANLSIRWLDRKLRPWDPDEEEAREIFALVAMHPKDAIAEAWKRETSQ